MARRTGKRRTGKSFRAVPTQRLPKAARLVAELAPDAALVGGFAMQFFGSRRLTGDLDFLVSEVPEGVPVSRHLSFGGVKTVVGGVPTNFIVRTDDARRLYAAALAAAETLPGLPNRVVPPEWLLSLKLYAGRPKDTADIQTLLGWDIDRDKALAIAKRCLGIMAAKDLRQMMDIADWHRGHALDGGRVNEFDRRVFAEKERLRAQDRVRVEAGECSWNEMNRTNALVSPVAHLYQPSMKLGFSHG